MNKQELSLLGFLAESMVASPSSKNNKVLDENLRESNSTAFRNAVDILKDVIEEVPQSSSREDRLRILHEKSLSLSQERSIAAKSVGDVLQWAVIQKVR